MEARSPSRPTTYCKQEIPDDLKCSICLEVPLRPNITPCDHLFCDTCLQRALVTQRSCPNCRSSCEIFDTKRLKNGSLLHRIWSSIQVKCSNHEGNCPWRGSIGDYIKHAEECELQHMYRKVDSLNKRTDFLETKNQFLENSNQELKLQMRELKKENKGLKAENKRIQKALDEGVKEVLGFANRKRQSSTQADPLVAAKKRRQNIMLRTESIPCMEPAKSRLDALIERSIKSLEDKNKNHPK